MVRGICRIWGWALAVLLALMAFATPAQAANCYVATSQGTTGPTDWNSYCWLDFTAYNDTTARSAGGQAFTFTLADGTTVTMTMKVTTPAALIASTSPSWTGGAVGNTAFLGIGGRPILYQSAAGTTTVTFSNITLTPPSGGSVTAYMMVAGDAESTNDGESLQFQTNGAAWQLLDTVGPISGSTYPTTTGVGTTTFTETGVAGTVGAYIVGSSTPTTLTTTMVGGGLQGSMFAIRFASISLTNKITGARANAADQFKFDVAATGSGTVLSTGSSSGTGLGPFAAASLSTAASFPLTLQQSMATGSVDTLSHYQASLTCTNGSTGSTTVLPSNVLTSSYNFGALKFGDQIACTFTDTPFPHLTLQKALAAAGRQFATDQFTMKIDQGATNVATTTTTGTGTTVTSGATPQVQVSAATAYKFSEAASGTTVLGQYTATMACTNANASSGTTLPTLPGGSITPQIGDVVTCTITNTAKGANASLTIAKTSALVSDPVNGATNPLAIPGAIVRYTFTVTNTGPTVVDSNSVLLIDTLPSAITIGTAATPVFTQGTPTSALTFTASTDLKYSNSSTKPTTFAGCTYTPVATYDPAVKFVCLNPKGTMAGSTGTPPGFTISLQTKLN
ncbi:CshA/CshB family fibrillar adhesin-related protein [Novosphingobium lentum]|uniref:CshA/CshB family fibrillar adhesin-related protein n=1 Tax=Novosphingobium lentum TaxID=145287 RepID=UPI00082BF1AD|nr:CshA/CshB family fibrillar adhesin-related protein [Novosphingobium lentum]